MVNPTLREETPDPVMLGAVLGSLYLLEKKSGEVKQHFQIDAQRITFGRDADCDIRIHWEDVSRVHAEVNFDLVTGQAMLSVLGSNGLQYTPATTKERIKLEAGKTQTLSSGDCLIIRKKQFRFEYPAEPSTTVLSPSSFGTPVKSKAVASPMKAANKGTPVRRRASHRLSLMPVDKPFVPLSPIRKGSDSQSSPKKGSSILDAMKDDRELIVMEAREDIKEEEEEEVIQVEENSLKPPKTPRSIPLPAASDTPYNAKSYIVTPPRVSARIAMSTPAGPMTLHKALLLRSARKVWVEQKPQGIDGAVEDGNVEMRRKSTSPSKTIEGKRKSLTPRASLAAPAESESDEEDEEGQMVDAVEEQDGQLDNQVMEETPQEAEREMSFESDSAEDSLEADLSLDINDRNAINADTPAEGQVEEENEERDDFDQHSAPSIYTPVASRILGKFFTPQVSRQQPNLPRRSLASIGGPAVRPTPVKPSPNPLAGGASRAVRSEPVPAFSFQEPEIEGEEAEVVQTPVKVSDHELAEIKKRRQSLATPRALPSAPTSFKEPIKAPFSLAKTPSHPALTRSPNKDDITSTPMASVRSKLDKMKAEQILREQIDKERRSTIGYTVSQTPVKPALKTSASYTVHPIEKMARFKDIPIDSPTIEATEVDETISTLPSFTSTPKSAKKVGTPFKLLRHSPIPESPISPNRASSASPTSKGSPKPLKKKSSSDLKSKALKEAQTTHLNSIKSLYPSLDDNKQSKEVDVINLKKLYPDVPLPPKTPDMRGLKQMYGNAKIRATPDMAGMDEMFKVRSPEKIKDEENDVEEGDSEIPDVVEHRSPATTRKQKQAIITHNEEEEEGEEEEEVEEVETPAKRQVSSASVRARKAEMLIAPATASNSTMAKESKSSSSKTKGIRSKADTSANLNESTSTVSRATSRSRKAVPTEIFKADEEPLPAKTTRGKSAPTRTKPVVAEAIDEPEVKSAPARRGRKPLGESTDQPSESVEVVEPRPIKSTRIARKAVPALNTQDEEVKATSTSSRKTRTAVAKKEDKENVVEEKTLEEPKPRATRGRVAKKEVAVEVEAPSRSTRSRR